MWLIVLALASGMIAGLCLGGQLRRLSDTRLRGVGLLVVGAGCELAGSRWGAGWLGNAILIGGYVLLVAFALRNAAITGMVLVAIGLAANLTVIALNGGMPVRGLAPGSYGPRHHAERPGDRLTGLADVVPLSPIGETVSAGDIVLSLGVATVLVSVLRPPRRRRREWPAPAGPDRLARQRIEATGAGKPR